MRVAGQQSGRILSANRAVTRSRRDGCAASISVDASCNDDHISFPLRAFTEMLPSLPSGVLGLSTLQPDSTSYVQMTAADQVLEGSSLVIMLFNDLSALIPHAGPLSQVLGAVSGVIGVVNEVQDLRESCDHLLERILNLYKGIVEELSRMNVNVEFGSPTHARLFPLERNMLLIKADIVTWRDWGRAKRVIYRKKIKAGLDRHAKNLEDCFRLFDTQTLIQLSAAADAVSEKSAGQSSTIPQNMTSSSSPVLEEPQSIQTETSTDALSINDMLCQPAGLAMMEQLSNAVQSQLSDDEVRSRTRPEHPKWWDSDSFSGISGYVTALEAPFDESADPGTISPIPAIDEHSRYLMNRIADLTLEAKTASSAISDAEARQNKVLDLPLYATHRIGHGFGNSARTMRRAIADALKILDQLQGSQEHRAEILSMQLASLAITLAELGMREEALGVQTICVMLNRNHLQSTADSNATNLILAAEAELALSLHNLSNCLSSMGEKEAALKTVEEAVQLLQKLVGSTADPLASGLAQSLIALSNCLSDVGRREEALDVIGRAVGIHRQLASSDPSAFAADLALSLNNQSNHLSEMGQPEQALQTIEEAVVLSQHLSAASPAMLKPDLAPSLHNLSNRLSEVGQNREALHAIEEAVKLRRELAARTPEVFTPQLARSLHGLSNRLSDAGRKNEALEAIQEAVKLNRQLAAHTPAAFTSDLSLSLHAMSNHLSNLGRKGEALELISEAIRLQTQFMRNNKEGDFTRREQLYLSNRAASVMGIIRDTREYSTVRE